MTRAIPGEQFLSLRTGTKVWQIDITIDGKRIRESSGTSDKAAAARLASERYSVLWRAVKLGEKPKLQMTVLDALARSGDATAAGIAAVLERSLGAGTLLTALDDNLIDGIVKRWQQDDNLAPATVNRYLTGLSSLCARARDVWGAEVGTWTRSRHSLKEPRGRETFLDHEQAQRLLSKIVAHARPIVLLDLMTGLRKANAIGLTWEHVSLDLGRAVMIQKGGRPLSVVLVPEALALLRAVQPDPALRTGPVWVFANPAVPCDCPHCISPLYRGDPIRSIRRSFETAVREAGIPGRVRFHDLRHTFASWLLDQTGDLKLVQDLLGHASISTTARYTHLMGNRKAEAVEDAVAGLFKTKVERAA